ncbi:hypothetical protein AMAG_06714 [Allomyces macrogynus ATCC 38327]|uniref:Uncharacterized protein n=1 Tax=Allomyces macrogynus (strain ATCC 38327) TaxID=578462 RepID=A0A0L0SEM1_ALLM3|nr:hypothetical protein AMAG_06714 [Allomyces macrogynus ATCC 38327]|eukprot:KNE60953.1 hypothetical protein AMAG_06714 [Allomyces macrogynus ATCC 38327]
MAPGQTSPPRLKSQRVDGGPGTVELAFAPDFLPAQPTSPNRRARDAVDATPPRRTARKRTSVTATTEVAGQDAPADAQPPPPQETTTTTMLPAARLSAIAGSDPALYTTTAPTVFGATVPGRRRTLFPPPSRRNTGSPPGSRRASVDGRTTPAMRVAEGEAEGAHAIQSVLSDATQAMLAKLAVQQ